jgi:hypothetical protein
MDRRVLHLVLSVGARATGKVGIDACTRAVSAAASRYPLPPHASSTSRHHIGASAVWVAVLTYVVVDLSWWPSMPVSAVAPRTSACLARRTGSAGLFGRLADVRARGGCPVGADATRRPPAPPVGTKVRLDRWPRALTVRSRPRRTGVQAGSPGTVSSAGWPRGPHGGPSARSGRQII